MKLAMKGEILDSVNIQTHFIEFFPLKEASGADVTEVHTFRYTKKTRPRINTK